MGPRQDHEHGTQTTRRSSESIGFLAEATIRHSWSLEGYDDERRLAGDLLRPWQPDERDPDEPVYGGVAAYRTAVASTACDPLDLRSLVRARDRRHHQHRAENHPRLRRISSRVV